MALPHNSILTLTTADHYLNVTRNTYEYLTTSNLFVNLNYL